MRLFRYSLVLAGVLGCEGGPSSPSTGSVTTGNLAIAVNGLPSGTDAAITVSGPDGYSHSVTATQTLDGLVPGTYTVSAQDVVALCGTLYSASPASQDVSVVEQETATASVTHSPTTSEALNLCIDGMYLTQSTQTYAGAVPLVQNRDGYLRVFVVANSANLATPAVRVRFYQNLVLQSEVSIAAPGLSVPTGVDESSLSYSWNVPVAGSLIQPGLSVLAEVDIENAVTESDESDNAFPAGGPLAMSVRTVPTLAVTFVPVLQSGLLGDVSDIPALLAMTRDMHPIDGIDAIVHSQHPTTHTLQADGTGWVEVLTEIEAIRTSESSSRYYYGVAKVSYTSGVAGVAYVGGRTALGWDYLPTGSIVAAHELGHNWGRNHAPCGDPLDPDPDYPYSDGSIGVYGLDVAAEALKPPSSSDIMGYCDSKWISDYTYSGILDYFGSSSALVMSADGVQPSMLVWGYIGDDGIQLEPAFQVNTRPSLPRRAGPYTLEARSSDGSTVFAISFSPSSIADAPGARQSFVFAVPLPAAEAGRVASLRVTGRGREAVLRAPAQVASPRLQLERVTGRKARLRWNAAAYPMAMVRDPETGEVLSLARGGDAQFATSKAHVDVVLSDGVKSRLSRLPVAAP